MLEKETFIKRQKVEENVERVTVKIVYFNIYIYIIHNYERDKFLK